jgi:signal transduction histidine kinase
VDEEASMLRRLAALGYQPELEEAYSALPLDLVNPTVDAVRGERALWLESCEQVAAAYPSLADDYRATGFEAMAIVPLSVGGRATGVIALNFSETKSFRTDERRLLLALAGQCGQALERATLHAELQERADAASVLAHVGDGVFQLDHGDRITLWNRGAEVITDITESESVGRHIGEIFPGWDAIRDRISITDVPLAFGRREALPLQLVTRELMVAISGVATGEGIVYAFRDVTESEKLEKARRDFLATASHELRTPLAGMFGATKTLLHRELDEPTRQALLQVIDSESERLAGILDDMLFASQLDADTIQLSLGTCDVAALALEAVELQRARVPDGLTLRLDVPREPPAAACDSDKLRQVLLNLIDNAIKYSPAGGDVTVSIKVDDDVVRIAVADTGLGIAAAERERVFEKFYRLDPELSRGVGGTGLGLYISRQFVERMDGRIWVESREGKGSTFYVELPRAA